jgi:transforming growth factor-beta-induced protein
MKIPFNKLLALVLIPLLTLSLFTACGDDDSGVTDGDELLNIVETAQEDGRFTTLVGLIQDADLADALSSDELTVFAPTDAAFEELFEVVDPSTLTTEDIAAILTYHVTEGAIASGDLQAQQDVEMLNGELTLVQSSAAGVVVNGSSNVVVADVEATNGVIHAVDEVLLPEEFRVAVEGPSLVEIAEDAGNFTTLLDLVEQGGLTTTLQFLGPYTTFAPTDAAFEALFAEIDPATLTEEQVEFILTYHVIIGAPILSTDLQAQQTVTAANDEALYITSGQEGVVVNGSANVGPADLEASNGVVHVVDQVLLPNAFLNAVQVAQKNYNFTTLVDLIVQANLVDAVATSEITVFAPTNDAFDALFAEVDPGTLTPDQVENILLYHTIIGSTVLSTDLAAEQTVESGSTENLFITADSEGVVVNGNSSVVTPDVEATNGVIHAVDTVLLPNAFLNTAEVAQKNYNFTTLVDLLVQADLVDAVANNEITVFAPTNDAFDALFAEVDPATLTTAQIENILLYHTIIGSTILSTDLAAEQTVESGSTEALYVTAGEGGVSVNASSAVVTPDVESANGVIHAIDSVLLPNAFLDVTGIASKNYNLTTLVGLLADNDLVGTLQGDGPFTVFAPTNAAFEAIDATLATLTGE